MDPVVSMHRTVCRLLPNSAVRNQILRSFSVSVHASFVPQRTATASAVVIVYVEFLRPISVPSRPDNLLIVGSENMCENVSEGRAIRTTCNAHLGDGSLSSCLTL